MNLTCLPNSSNAKLSTAATIKDLKDSNTDFEWYPTTDRMIQKIIADVNSADYSEKASRIIDIGAGDGRVLQAFYDDKDLHVYDLLGVEKSPNHVSRWSSKITFIGGNFYESEVNAGKVDIAFSNPPFGDYENWVVHLIKNVYATVTYLVLPSRWVNSERIQAALKARALAATVIMSDDFTDADRGARAKVDVIRICSDFYKSKAERRGLFLDDSKNYPYSFSIGRQQDPVDAWFDKMFPRLASLSDGTVSSSAEPSQERTYGLFLKTNTISDLVMLYQLEADKVLKNYEMINELDIELFIELNIDIKTIKKSVKARMSSLKTEYWRAFIHNYKPITERLTAKYREKIFETLINRAESISFNEINALIITQMVIKLANEYSEDQVKDFFYDLSNTKSVLKYKSNQKVFSGTNWRYVRNHESMRPTHYTLDYRIVQDRLFSVSTHWTDRCRIRNDDVVKVVSDVCIIARLIGMKIPSHVNGSDFNDGEIMMGKRMSVTYSKDGKLATLFDLKFYKNGNQHLFLDQEFAMRLNLYIGKLLGWVMSADEAFDEMETKDVDRAEFTKMFDEAKVQHLTLASTKHLIDYQEAG